MRYLILLLLLITTASAAENSDSAAKERLEKVAAEVARRKALREAQELIYAHEYGKKKATDAELAAARAVLREADAQRSKQPKGYAVSLADADTQAVAQTWLGLFGEEIVVGDRAKARIVNIKLSDPSLEELKKRFELALHANDLVLMRERAVVVLDVAPNSKERK